MCHLNIHFSITYYWYAWNTVLKYALRLLDKLENFCNKFRLHIKFILIYIKMLQNISVETLTSSMSLSLLHIKITFQSQVMWKGLFYSTSLYYSKYKSWHSPSESWCLYIHIHRDTTNGISYIFCYSPHQQCIKVNIYFCNTNVSEGTGESKYFLQYSCHFYTF